MRRGQCRRRVGHRRPHAGRRERLPQGAAAGVPVRAGPALLRRSGSLLDERMVQQVGPRQSLLGVLLQQALQKRLEVRGHVLGVGHWVLDYEVDERDQRVRVEGWLANEQLVADHSERPEIRCAIVGFLPYQLRCHVQRCPFDGSQHRGLARHYPGESEVAQLDDVVCADQHVLRFHVPVHDLLAVQIVQGEHQLSRDSSHFFLRKVFVILENLEELTVSKLCDYDKVCAGLERIQHLNDVRMVEPLQNPDLGPQVRQIFVGLPSLGYELERDNLPGELPPALEDLSEATLADDVQNVVLLHVCTWSSAPPASRDAELPVPRAIRNLRPNL
mmetsp:Transcript_153156/g.491132  ORF Transcript_153156/g.491132 Transcript_153156/m.491132 type:complete len:331 (-) Transcript_153156:72-1064(-)